jgi:hypothetical protein
LLPNPQYHHQISIQHCNYSYRDLRKAVYSNIKILHKENHYCQSLLHLQ